MHDIQFVIQNPEFRETIREHVTRQEFMKLLGCHLTVIEPGYVEAVIDLGKEHQQQIGLVHGGVTATIADVAAGFAGFTLVARDEHTVTAEIKISYLRKGRGNRLRAVGRVVKAGSAFHFCEAEVFCTDAEGIETLIAKATTTMAVIRVTSQ
ncbi:MAG: PaaI family thioesterase [Candidatus Kapabacteria bacterium]|nr:PaaI family thioesterase [Candidatus Kapabacteria bacterium]